MVDQRLHVGEDAFGVGFVTHDHHVLHFQQRHAVGAGPEEQHARDGVREKEDGQTGWSRIREDDILFQSTTTHTDTRTASILVVVTLYFSSFLYPYLSLFFLSRGEFPL